MLKRFHNILDNFACCGKNDAPVSSGSPQQATRASSIESLGDLLMELTRPNSSGSNSSISSNCSTTYSIASMLGLGTGPNDMSLWDKRRIKPMLTVYGSMSVAEHQAGQSLATTLAALATAAVTPVHLWGPAYIDSLRHTSSHDACKLPATFEAQDLPRKVKFCIGDDFEDIGVNTHILSSSVSLGLKRSLKTVLDTKFKSLYKYMKHKYAERKDEIECILKLGTSTYGVMRDGSKAWWLFDSTGKLNIPATKRDVYTEGNKASSSQGASLSKFTNLKALVKLLVQNHSSDTEAEILEVTSVADLDLSLLEEVIEKSPSSTDTDSDSDYDSDFFN